MQAMKGGRRLAAAETRRQGLFHAKEVSEVMKRRFARFDIGLAFAAAALLGWGGLPARAEDRNVPNPSQYASESRQYPPVRP